MNTSPTRSLPRARFHGLSPVVAGCWRMAGWGMEVDARIRWIEGCIEIGVTSFDHADIYGDYAVEGLFGEALARAPGLRQRLQLVSKCGIRLVSPARPGHRIKSYDTSAAHIVASVDHSLHALRTDHLDLLLIHRPDPLLDVAEVAGAFERLQRAGKVLRWRGRRRSGLIASCACCAWKVTAPFLPGPWCLIRQLPWIPLPIPLCTTVM